MGLDLHATTFYILHGVRLRGGPEKLDKIIYGPEIHIGDVLLLDLPGSMVVIVFNHKCA